MLRRLAAVAATSRHAVPSSMALYAAYGTNMDAEQMLGRCPHSPAVGTGWLEGWRLTFGGEEHGWEGAIATLAEEPDSHVFVVLYDLNREDERRLDEIELAVATAEVPLGDGEAKPSEEIRGRVLARAAQLRSRIHDAQARQCLGQ